MLFRAIAMPSDEPVQYVGVYVLRWGDGQLDPEVGFAPVDVDTAIPWAVDRIVEDLCGRRGLRQEWEQIDSDIRDEITQTWQRLIESALIAANG